MKPSMNGKPRHSTPQPLPTPVKYGPGIKEKLEFLEDERQRLLCIGKYNYMDPSRGSR